MYEFFIHTFIYKGIVKAFTNRNNIVIYFSDKKRHYKQQIYKDAVKE